MALVAAAEAVASEPKQGMLPLPLRDEPAVDQASAVVKPTEAVVEKIEPTICDVSVPPAEAELSNAVREILRRELVEARTENEVASLMVVTKGQAKEWLARLVDEGVLEKVTKPKPLRYRTAKTSDRLF
jgi:hypothetical protein